MSWEEWYCFPSWNYSEYLSENTKMSYCSGKISHSRNSHRKLLPLINAFSKLGAYKINTQKPEAFLYTNGRLRKESGKSFTIASKRVGITQTKQVTYLYN